jgi:NADH:ubiquinone oxidoreductase subunit E
MVVVDIAQVDAIIEQSNANPAQLIGVLQDIQGQYGYLPQDALRQVALRLQVPLSRVFSVANFYKAFSLKPRGRHVCQVCLGTACHVRGATQILEQAERTLHIKAGDTTADGEYTLETVHCVGACALGPVLVLDGEYQGRMTVGKVQKVFTVGQKAGG